ncbi:hypothetical protein TA3x_002084 [Tundrisphaera sp. TA3]|uniref:hypothetical protein n=1 Tax=Tundrisphaera sp. TA3 TaxID=3435775 RepID=UPI003EBA8C0B
MADLEPSLLLDVLMRLDRESLIGRFRFEDGESYNLRISSLGHLEAGDDVVAEVVEVVSSTSDLGFISGSLINFKSAEVTQVLLDGRIAFSRESS